MALSMLVDTAAQQRAQTRSPGKIWSWGGCQITPLSCVSSCSIDETRSPASDATQLQCTVGTYKGRMSMIGAPPNALPVTWSRPSTILVQLFKAQPCLWKVKCKEYKDRVARAVALNRIATLMKDDCS